MLFSLYSVYSSLYSYLQWVYEYSLHTLINKRFCWCLSFANFICKQSYHTGAYICISLITSESEIFFKILLANSVSFIQKSSMWSLPQYRCFPMKGQSWHRNTRVKGLLPPSRPRMKKWWQDGVRVDCHGMQTFFFFFFGFWYNVQ